MSSPRKPTVAVVRVVRGLPGLRPTLLDSTLVVAAGRSHEDTAARIAEGLRTVKGTWRRLS